MLDRSGRVMPRSQCHTEPICHLATGHPARCVPSVNTFIEYSKIFWCQVQHVVYQVSLPSWTIPKAVCVISFTYSCSQPRMSGFCWWDALLMSCKAMEAFFMVRVVVYSGVFQMDGANQTLYCAWAVSLSLVVKGKSSVRRGITRDKQACLQNFLFAKASFAFTSVSHCQLSCQCFISIFPSM